MYSGLHHPSCSYLLPEEKYQSISYNNESRQDPKQDPAV